MSAAVGRLGCLVATVLGADVVSAFRAYDRNLRWAKAHDAELDKFQNQFVAIADEKVLAASPARAKVDEAARAHAGAYVTFVVKRGLIWIL
jgi:hypothetical protein